jgi:hypothetical protein
MVERERKKQREEGPEVAAGTLDDEDDRSC